MSLARWKTAFLVAALLAGSCGRAPVAPQGGMATLIVRVDVSGTNVATVVVEVTATDIPAALDFNIPVTNHVASGTLTVPAGSTRVIAMRAFDAGGVETHDGSVTLDVQPGTNPPLSVVLRPLTGEVPLTATLGSGTVAVTPNALTLSVGGTRRLVASITDWQGNVVSGPASWATHDPGVAFVDSTGLVTARRVGSTTVVATFQGAEGAATVIVGP